MKRLDNRPIAWVFGLLRQVWAGPLLILLASHVAWAGEENISNSALKRCNLPDIRSSGDSQTQAVACFREAAEQGDRAAQMVLGLVYWQGNGVAQDPVEAYKWLVLASRRSEEMAGVLKQYEWQMTPEQVAKAKQAARKWTAAHAH